MSIMGPDYIASGGFDAESSFDLSVNPDKVLKEENSRHGIDSFLYEFSVEKYNSSKPFDLRPNMEISYNVVITTSTITC